MSVFKSLLSEYLAIMLASVIVDNLDVVEFKRIGIFYYDKTTLNISTELFKVLDFIRIVCYFNIKLKL